MNQKLICQNRKATHEYHILEKWEAGLSLSGTEVKSLREGSCQIAEAFVLEKGGDLYLQNSTIGIYKQGNRWNHEQNRQRKLLLHKREINHIIDGIHKKGCTAIPLKMYFKDSWVKVELALCRGKDQIDKRQDKFKQEAKREMERVLKAHRR